MRVWIMGAGFSARLGGPMLRDLLSPRSLEILRIRHPETWLHGSQPGLVVTVFHEGLKLNYWSHAEQFLSAVHSYDEHFQRACGDILRSLSGDAMQFFMDRQDHETDDEVAAVRIATMATALVAAQCHDFVDLIVDDDEAWLPYDRWVKALTEEDVLITFNYDIVVEKAFQRQRRTLCLPNPRLQRMSVDPAAPMLLKLHGSVLFRDTIEQPREPYDVRSLIGNPALIAVPGKGKSTTAEMDFDQLWDLAEDRLCRADQVIVVGYSCPASDEMAKAWFVDGLAKNARHPSVHIVLGPDGSPDAARLVALLRATRDLDITDSKLWAQDYLTIHGVGQGWRPEPWREEALTPYYEDLD